MIPIVKSQFGDMEIQAVSEVLRSDRPTRDSKIVELEEKFAEYIGSRYAVMTSSGTAALQLMLLAAGIKPGDKVITTPFAFSATADSIVLCGAEPVFVDIEESTYNISVEALKVALQTVPGIKAILVVHLFGLPADMAEIMGLAKKNRVQVFENAAQAHGARANGKRVGSIGRAGAFSFNANKNMTCDGGGIITTNDSGLAKTAAMLANHGRNRDNMHLMAGYNYRANGIQAALGIAQLAKLPGFNRERQFNAFYYSGNIINSSIILPLIRSRYEHVYNKYTIKSQSRDKLIHYLKNNGIEAKVYYPLLIQYLTSYKAIPFYDCGCPVAERVSKQVLSLPVHPLLTPEQLKHIADRINEYKEPDK